MNIIVNPHDLTIEKKDIVNEGEYNITQLNFQFSNEYTDDLVKKAIFIGDDSKAYEMLINDDKCMIPSEILLKKQLVTIGVYAYKITGSELTLRYSPSPIIYQITDGSYKADSIPSEEITPSQFEQYQQALQNGLAEVNEKLQEVIDTSIDLEENGTYAKEQGDYAKETTDELVSKVENGDFNGATFTPSVSSDGYLSWSNDKGLDNPTTVNIKGQKGDKGEPGLAGTNGTNGANGKDATINGQNTVEITTDNNIALDQQESVLKLSLNSQLIPKQNVEGTDNTFDDGLESPLFALGGDGNSEQVVTTGKQLLPYPYVETSKTTNGITYTVNNDGSVLLNGTATSDTSLTLFGDIEGTSTYNIPGDYVSGGTSDAHVRVVARLNGEYHLIADNTSGFTKIDKSVYTKGYVEIKITAGKTLNNVIIKPMLSNEQNIPWEPYTNGIPSPSPDYEQPINSIEGSLEFACRGKNLCNGINQNYYINLSANRAGILAGNSGLVIKINKDNYVISSKITQERYRVGLCNTLPTTTDGTPISIFNGVSKDGTKDNIVINTTGYDYLIINASNLNSIQVEQGTQATEINPYIEPNQVTFNLNEEKLRSVGDVKDELVVDLDTGDYYKVENVGEVVFDGSDDEKWSLDDDNRFVIYDMDKNVASTSNQLCNMASNFNRYASSPNTFGLEYDFIRIYNTANLTLEEWKTLITTTNLIISCELQTPTTKKLGTLSAEDLAKLKTFKGYNNVTVNTNLGLMNIRFTYGLDIKKYVDNKIAELSAQLIRGE